MPSYGLKCFQISLAYKSFVCSYFSVYIVCLLLLWAPTRNMAILLRLMCWSCALQWQKTDKQWPRDPRDHWHELPLTFMWVQSQTQGSHLNGLIHRTCVSYLYLFCCYCCCPSFFLFFSIRTTSFLLFEKSRKILVTQWNIIWASSEHCNLFTAVHFCVMCMNSVISQLCQ